MPLSHAVQNAFSIYYIKTHDEISQEPSLWKYREISKTHLRNCTCRRAWLQAQGDLSLHSICLGCLRCLACLVLFCRLFLIWVFFLFSEEMSFFSRFSSVLCLNCQEAAWCSPGLILVECNITRDNHWLQCDEKVLPSLSRACAHQ